MKYYFHEDAETEFTRAVEYYENCQHGLGRDFAREVYATIARIIQFPNAWSSMSKNTRRCMMHRFPFGLIYRIKSRNIQIIAVADLRRSPGYWKERK